MKDPENFLKNIQLSAKELIVIILGYYMRNNLIFLVALIIAYTLTLIFREKIKSILKISKFKPNHGEKPKIDKRPPLLSYLRLFAFLVLIILLMANIYYRVDLVQKQTRAKENLPIKESYVFDFEDPGSTLIWVTSSKTNTITTSDDKKLSKSGKNSLCLNVNLQPIESECWCDIGIWNQYFNEVKAITAWVLIPETKQTSNNRLGAYIRAGRYTQKEETHFKSNEIDIVPGKWNKVCLDSFSFDKLGKPVYLWDSIINVIAIVVWSQESYSGPIYFDDITVYTDVGRLQ